MVKEEKQEVFFFKKKINLYFQKDKWKEKESDGDFFFKSKSHFFFSQVLFDFYAVFFQSACIFPCLEFKLVFDKRY
jgi:hypothetical protein